MALAMEGNEPPASEPEEPICELCEDATATWVIDKDITHGGGEDGPEWDAPVLRVACSACKERSSYMDPEPITPAWERYFRAPWTFYDPPYAKRNG